MDRLMAQLPHSTRQWVHFALAATFLLLVFMVVMATAQHLADDQYISADELKREATALQSYAAEGQILSRHTKQKSALRPYVEAYGSALQESTDSAAEKLTEHPHAKSLDTKVVSTITLANRLSGQLHDLASEPPSQQSAQETQAFQDMASRFQKIGDSL